MLLGIARDANSPAMVNAMKVQEEQMKIILRTRRSFAESDGVSEGNKTTIGYKV